MTDENNPEGFVDSPKPATEVVSASEPQSAALAASLLHLELLQQHSAVTGGAAAGMTDMTFEDDVSYEQVALGGGACAESASSAWGSQSVGVNQAVGDSSRAVLKDIKTGARSLVGNIAASSSLPPAFLPEPALQGVYHESGSTQFPVHAAYPWKRLFAFRRASQVHATMSDMQLREGAHASNFSIQAEQVHIHDGSSPLTPKDSCPGAAPYVGLPSSFPTIRPPRLDLSADYLRELNADRKKEEHPLAPPPLPDILSFAIGTDNFQAVAEAKKVVVDKSLLVRDVLQSPSEVNLIIRPRRFGKTFNLSMLACFFDRSIKSRATPLFEKLKIWAIDNGIYQGHQGHYPVIFLTLKDINQANFEDALEMFKEVISKLYRVLHDKYKFEITDEVKQIIDCTASKARLQFSLKNLAEILEKHCGAKAILLIDEYDTPIHAAYSYSKECNQLGKKDSDYARMNNFIRGLFGSALKGNTALYKAVLTGILRVSKENIFSGLNNITVYSVLQDDFSEYFGFSENEVVLQMQNAFGSRDHAVHIPKVMEKLEYWYGGYQIGKSRLFSPWSVAQFIEAYRKLGLAREMQFKDYWINTSSNELIISLLEQANGTIKKDIVALFHNKAIVKTINEHTVFVDITKDPATLWSFLLLSGYLTTYQDAELGFLEPSTYRLVIPNKELHGFYAKYVREWFKDVVQDAGYVPVVFKQYKKRVALKDDPVVQDRAILDTQASLTEKLRIVSRLLEKKYVDFVIIQLLLDGLLDVRSHDLAQQLSQNVIVSTWVQEKFSPEDRRVILWAFSLEPQRQHINQQAFDYVVGKLERGTEITRSAVILVLEKWSREKDKVVAVNAEKILLEALQKSDQITVRIQAIRAMALKKENRKKVMKILRKIFLEDSSLLEDVALTILQNWLEYERNKYEYRHLYSYEEDSEENRLIRETLILALQSKQQATQLKAVQVFQQVVQSDRASVVGLRVLLEKGAPEIQRAVLITLGKWAGDGNSSARRTLFRHLKSVDPMARLWAVQAFGASNKGSKQMVLVLQPLLMNDTEEIQKTIAAILEKWAGNGNIVAEKNLLLCLNSKDESVRLQVVKAFGASREGSEEAAIALKSLLVGDSEQIQDAALTILKKWASNDNVFAQQALCSYLQQQILVGPTTRLQIIEVLGKSQRANQKLVETLKYFLTDSNPTAREIIVSTFARWAAMGYEEAILAIKDELHDPIYGGPEPIKWILALGENLRKRDRLEDRLLFFPKKKIMGLLKIAVANSDEAVRTAASDILKFLEKQTSLDEADDLHTPTRRARRESLSPSGERSGGSDMEQRLELENESSTPDHRTPSMSTGLRSFFTHSMHGREQSMLEGRVSRRAGSESDVLRRVERPKSVEMPKSLKKPVRKRPKSVEEMPPPLGSHDGLFSWDGVGELGSPPEERAERLGGVTPIHGSTPTPMPVAGVGTFFLPPLRLPLLKSKDSRDSKVDSEVEVEMQDLVISRPLASPSPPVSPELFPVADSSPMLRIFKLLDSKGTGEGSSGEDSPMEDGFVTFWNHMAKSRGLELLPSSPALSKPSSIPSSPLSLLRGLSSPYLSHPPLDKHRDSTKNTSSFWGSPKKRAEGNPPGVKRQGLFMARSSSAPQITTNTTPKPTTAAISRSQSH